LVFRSANPAPRAREPGLLFSQSNPVEGGGRGPALVELASFQI
jgi:hypothetical protein